MANIHEQGIGRQGGQPAVSGIGTQGGDAEFAAGFAAGSECSEREIIQWLQDNLDGKRMDFYLPSKSGRAAIANAIDALCELRKYERTISAAGGGEMTDEEHPLDPNDGSEK